MRSSRLRQRLAATALTALAVGAGALATAAPATAGDGSTIFGEDNTVAVGSVTLASQTAIAADVTYSCEPQPALHLAVVWRLADERDSDIRAPRGEGSVQNSALTCDRNKHDVQITAPEFFPGDSLPFGVGDPVEVTALLSDAEGVPYARIVQVATL